MSELYRVNRHYPAVAKVAPPLLVGILVIDSILDVIRQQVFQFDRRVKPEGCFWKLPPGMPFNRVHACRETESAYRWVMSLASTCT